LDVISATLDTPAKPFIVKEVRVIIKNLNPKKGPGFDIIQSTNQVLQMLPEIEIKFNLTL